jgi:CRP-like cAMP-binding protein
MGSCLSVPSPADPADGGGSSRTTGSKTGAAGSKWSAKSNGSSKRIKRVEVTAAAGVSGAASASASASTQLKRLAVAAQAIHSLADVSITRYPHSQKSAQMILDVMSSSVSDATTPTTTPAATTNNSSILFEGLSMVTRQAIMETMAPVQVKAGDEVIREGEDGSEFYIVDSGAFAVSKGGVEVGRCGPGEGFGEIGAMYESPRTATVTAVTAGKLWRMERHVYQAIKVAFTKHVELRKVVALGAVPLLEGLPVESKGQMADVMRLEEFKEHEFVFRQNDVGDKFYIVDQGGVSVAVDGEVVAELGPGAYFGERALIHGDRRNADIIATTFTSVFSIERGPFQQFFGSLQHAWTYSVLKNTEAFSALSEAQLLQVAAEMHQVVVAPGEAVFRVGDPGDAFYIVERGECDIVDARGETIATCVAGKCFGEMALLSNRPRGASAIAGTRAGGTGGASRGTGGGAPASDRALLLLRGDVPTFRKYLGDLNELKNMWKIDKLQKVPLLVELSRRDLSALCDCFAERTYESGEVVFREGEEGSEFFVIEAGHCSVIKSSSPLKGHHKEVAQLGPGHCFGERALLRRDPRMATVKAATPLKVMVLHRADFFEQLSPSVLESLSVKVGKLDAQAMGGQGHRLPAGLKLRKADLKLVRVLGKGAFGKVYLVRYKANNIKYALKCIKKEKVIASRLTEHVVREKEVMEHLQSPFLVSLAASFQDSSHLYMMMQLVEGGELFNYLSERDRPLSEAEARFYGACVVLGLEELQRSGIAWRDLKPENILLDVAGYAMLTDFGFAKVIERGKKSFTMCGASSMLLSSSAF